MSIIQGVIREEHDRLKKLDKKYIEEILLLPKGSISKKERNGKFYIYLVFREKRKVITKYIGRTDSDKSKGVVEQVKKRKLLEDKLKKVRSNLKELDRVLNGKKI